MCISLGISPDDLSLEPTDKDLHSGHQLNLLTRKEQNMSTITRETIQKSFIGSKKETQTSPTISVRTADHM